MPSRVSLPCRRRPPVPSREPDLANFARASTPVAPETFHPCIPRRSMEGRRRLPGMNSHRAPHSASDGRGGEFFSLESSAGGGGREGREPRFSLERSSGSGRTGEVVFPGVLGREAAAGRKLSPERSAGGERTGAEVVFPEFSAGSRKSWKSFFPKRKNARTANRPGV